MKKELDAQNLDWLCKWADYSPDAVAVKDGDSSEELSYLDFYRQALAGAEILRNQFGVKAGDRVAVLAANDVGYLVLFFAVQRLGAILVPLNYRLTPREVDHVMQDCEPRLIIHQTEFQELVDKSNPQAQRATLSDWNRACKKNAGHSKAEKFAGTEDSTAMIIYTSGTTGAPKGAMISNSMLFWNSINTTLRLDISEKDVAVIFLPLFHTGGWNVLTTPFFHRGAKIILLKKFEADLVLKLSTENHCTLLFGVPTTMDMMSRSNQFQGADFSHLRYAIVGGEPMPLPLIETWHRAGVAIRQGYGLTEFGPNVFSLSEHQATQKMGSIGFPNFYIQAKIVDDQMNELGPDEVGELVLQGPCCMQGYWRNEAATRETITDGWLHTGDLVRKDSEGYFYVVGRKKDMYKSGGENVYPVEVEQVVRKMQGVLEVAVIGVPDEKWGEVGAAFVVVTPEVTENQLREHCRSHLAKFKNPKHYKFLKHLPKGDSGKVLKRTLSL